MAHDEKVVVRVRVQIKPDQIDAFTRYMAQESEQARALEGCERYEVFRATDGDGGTFLLYEEWASQAAFDAYRNSPLLKQSFAVLGPMMAGPPDSAYYSAHAFE